MKRCWLLIFVLMTAVVPQPGGAAQMPAVGARGMVVTEQAQATRVGVAVLRNGGNAVDAAVAVGYALAVTDPCCGNIGGGGFMIIHHAAGGNSFINFRERAPLHAREKMYLDTHGNVIPGKSTGSWLAVGVPGTVAGLERARAEYGTMSRSQLLAPAIALARDGFALLPGDIDMLRLRSATFAKRPNIAAIFTPGGAPLHAGEWLKQPQLARTLRAIDRDGPAAFYRGSIARHVVAASRKNGGILTLNDFRRYTTEERPPLTCRYRSYTIVSAPPPSSGGTTLCEILSIVEAYPLARFGFGSAAAIHADVEAERLAYADRNTYLGDPDFVYNPVAQLLAPAYIARQRAKIGQRAAQSSAVHGGLDDWPRIDSSANLRLTNASRLGLAPAGRRRSADKFAELLAPPEHRQTAHYSIVDAAGNAVAVTYTINDDFGAGLIAGDTGFFLNNEMDDFTSKPGVANLYGLLQGKANAIAPGKRPLSSMAPTIVLQNGKIAIVAGSPGGSRIITITLGILQDLIDYGMGVTAAVAAPRFHHQWLPDNVEIEPGAITPPTRAALKALGYTFALRAPWGAAQAIVIDYRTGLRYGASDPRRRSGLALGY